MPEEVVKVSTDAATEKNRNPVKIPENPRTETPSHGPVNNDLYSGDAERRGLHNPWSGSGIKKCRLCFKEQGSLSMFKVSSFGTSIAMDLQFGSNMEIKQDPTLPSCVCVDCFNNIEFRTDQRMEAEMVYVDRTNE